MFLVVGVTQGDELATSSRKNMAACETRVVAEAEVKRLVAFGARWMAKFGYTIQPCQRGSLYSRFEIEEVPAA